MNCGSVCALHKDAGGVYYIAMKDICERIAYFYTNYGLMCAHDLTVLVEIISCLIK